MKLTWIEDYLALVKTGSFSKAAIMRNVTQPAFSRRIQMLERWLGVQLVDRRSATLRLTDVGQRYTDPLQALLLQVFDLRNRMRAESNNHQPLRLATQHTLSLTYLPDLLRIINSDAPEAKITVLSKDRDQAINDFRLGEAELLLCMEELDEALHDSLPDTERMIIGKEQLLPVTAPPDITRHALDASEVAPDSIHVITYPIQSALGNAIYKHCLPLLMRHNKVHIVHESVFAAGIKELVLAGLGMAWLPERLIERELRNGTLVQASPSVASVALSVAVYRKNRSKNHPIMEQVWACLRELRVD